MTHKFTSLRSNTQSPSLHGAAATPQPSPSPQHAARRGDGGQATEAQAQAGTPPHRDEALAVLQDFAATPELGVPGTPGWAVAARAGAPVLDSDSDSDSGGAAELALDNEFEIEAIPPPPPKRPAARERAMPEPEAAAYAAVACSMPVEVEEEEEEDMPEWQQIAMLRQVTPWPTPVVSSACPLGPL